MLKCALPELSDEIEYLRGTWADVPDGGLERRKILLHDGVMGSL